MFLQCGCLMIINGHMTIYRYIFQICSGQLLGAAKGERLLLCHCPPLWKMLSLLIASRLRTVAVMNRNPSVILAVSLKEEQSQDPSSTQSAVGFNNDDALPVSGFNPPEINKAAIVCNDSCSSPALDERMRRMTSCNEIIAYPSEGFHYMNL